MTGKSFAHGNGASIGNGPGHGDVGLTPRPAHWWTTVNDVPPCS